MTKTVDILKLPSLDIAHLNCATSFVAACNHRFAIYQVDHARPFWVVELDYNDKPMRPARRYHEHSTALECLLAMANSFLIGRDIELPAEV